MAETLSPSQKNRSRLQSPKSPFFLGSNDDCLERAQARAARAAAIRHRSLAVNAARRPSLGESDQCLGKQQILELFQNCIKLASENKINQKNTWDLNLIDHLCDIIKVEEEEDAETNFQKASCTLEAGVKIYSLRVDSVHSEAYKVLGGINRAGHENNQDNVEAEADNKVGAEEGHSKKLEKMSPASTLESSFDSLNVKKFDDAFVVDPLYHQTSAQFDEGGAKGLLLNNLGVYGSCKVLFDSFEIPGKCVLATTQGDNDELIDVTFAKEYIEKMVLNMQRKNEISPTLKNIVDQIDDDNWIPELNQYHNSNEKQPQASSACQGSSVEQAEAACHDDSEQNGGTYDNCGTWNFEHDDQTSIVDEDPTDVDRVLSENNEENEPYNFHCPNMDNRFEKVDGYLFLSLGFTSKHNAWAGPDHWKYRKIIGPDEKLQTEKGSPLLARRSRTKKKMEADIDFMAALNSDLSDIFAPPKNPKSLLLPAQRTACNTKLPEDCHYQPEDLVKLFLLPNIMCLGKRQRKPSDSTMDNNRDYGELLSWEDDNVCDGSFDHGNVLSDTEDSSTMIVQPRQVTKVEVRYDKTSKQVDVQALKEVLWEHIKQSSQVPCQGEAETVSFRDVLSRFPGDCRAAATIEDISPHLCFICLLHLANEHGLSIHGSDTMDDLSIHVCPSA
ncbi:hypothetical protein Nepgr_009003 [Nepenthes gracilis]|uniref:Condensin complex subunit 2 n=1 Tax=Nepenthes gracilis TaxID=150966 RepID=A0AAD3S9Z5_NEPGR|nr:hypothetical protein Nepgr_009003 [Nepenthes gracilis]